MKRIPDVAAKLGLIGVVVVDGPAGGDSAWCPLTARIPSGTG